jgi:glycosyltransferase involved in cell wall biosynthesis
MTTFWLDVKDLLDYAGVWSRPSGIQRLTLELYTAMHRLEPTRVRFVTHDRERGLIEIVPWQEIAAIQERMAAGAPKAHQDNPHLMETTALATPQSQSRLATVPVIGRALRALTQRLPLTILAPLGNAAYAQADSFAYLIQAFRNFGNLLADRLKATGGGEAPAAGKSSSIKASADVNARKPFANSARPGDYLLALGAPWADPGYSTFVKHLADKHGLRFGMMIYDLIPIVRPEFCERSLTIALRSFLKSAIPLAEVVFTISHATASDLTRWAKQEKITLNDEPVVVPIGTGFRHSEPSSRLPEGLVAGDYVLFVSTIEARKNHALAFRAWRRLIETSPPRSIPKLVFAGRVGWMIADLMQSLENSNYLDGHVVIVTEAPDDLLARLYTDARFTIFPSHYEGWGLPVSESLSFGKVCISSSSTSLPEAGGNYCLYHDPDSVTDAVAVYRRAIEDPLIIAEMETLIRNEHQPRSWEDCAQAILNRAATIRATDSRPEL